MTRYFVLIACAGSGQRFRQNLPKQYMYLGTKPVLCYSLAIFIEHPQIFASMVVLSPSDAYFFKEIGPRYSQALARGTCVPVYCGGAQRQSSVYKGLQALNRMFMPAANDWIIVHDAARPGLTTEVLDRLLHASYDHPVGGLLALPVVDSLKRARNGHDELDETLARTGLWLAQTPQIFRFHILQKALQRAQEQQVFYDDEAAAVTALQHKPLLVHGSFQNFKITQPGDDALMEKFVLSQD